ncbi:Metallo-hydrolase/oxidoreductase [Amylostereum chailletii]|nr:Metallo-hydrolase/oxidoreductase [Amylostereum chailletii]
MDKLEPLLSITRISDRVVRILGQNPGKFTLQGTNTYLVGRANPYILLDTGEGKLAYPPLLRTALHSPANPLLPDVSDIILTHRHHDHIKGLPSVLQLLRELWNERNPGTPFQPPRVHKYPLPSDTMPDAALSEVISDLEEGSYTPAADGPFHPLSDGQVFTPSVSAPDAVPSDQALTILHTPGHTTDSISLLFPADRALFTGDTVLGQGTAVFEDLALYLASLQKMLMVSRAKIPDDRYDQLYPAHGPVVREGSKMIGMYITHRLEREAQIVDVLRSPPPEGASEWTIWNIVGKLYAQYPQNLWEPAAHGVGLHLRKLEKEAKAKAAGGEGKEARWKLLA